MAQQGPTVPLQGASIEALQLRVAQLSQQLAGQRAERSVLERRINRMSQGDARATLEARQLQLDNQIAQTQVELDAAKAQIGAKLGVPGSLVGSTGNIIVQPPFIPRRGADPDMIVGLSFSLMMCIALPLAIAYARRIWRGKPKEATALADETAPRLDRLEQAVDAVAIEIERIAEGQRFVTKILAERPAGTPAPSAVSANSSGVPDGALGEAKPFLALGAGPMEPVRMPERQGVRQSITPH